MKTIYINISFLFLGLLLPFSAFSQNIVGSPAGQFAVSPTGAATYMAAIDVPEGINGMQPQIGIAYNSQSGIGNVGWGCNISGISAITRGAKNLFHDPVTKGLRYENDDAYYLDGKRLIYKSGTAGVAGGSYHPDGDPFTDITIKNGTYGTYFEVKTPDGMTTIYGNSDNSCIRFTSGGTQYVASWNVYSCTNATGQTIYYSYNTSDYYPCVSQIRYDLQDGTRNTINFTYSSLGSAAQGFRLKDVEGRIDKLLTKITCKTGNDVFRNYDFVYNKTSDGTAIKFPRLTEIKVTGTDGSSLPPIALTWNYLPNFVCFNSEEPHFSINDPTWTIPIQITDKKYLAHDMNGDGIDDIIQISIDSKSNEKRSFIHLLQTYRNSFNQIEYYPTRLYPIRYDYFIEKWGMGSQKSYHFGDFDGDGYADLLMPYLVTSSLGSNVFIQAFYGSKERLDTMQASPIHSILLQQSTNNLSPYTVIDMNNDGISEILVLEQSNYNYHLLHIFTVGQNRDFSEETAYLYLPSKPQKLFAADFNGDGLQDLLVICSNGYSLYWNRGGYRNQIAAPSFYTHFSESSDWLVTGTDIKDMLTMQLGDFNGDGLPDLLLNEYNNPRYHFALNNGNGTFTHTNDVQIDLFDDAKDNDDDKFTVIVNDFDYDGKSDVFIAHAHYEYHGLFHSTTYEYTDVQWHRSTGTSFSLMKSVRTKNKLDAQNGHITLGDIDGDGRLELINYGSDLTTNATVERTIKPRFYSDNMAVSSAKVSSITDGFGNTTQINYASLANPSVYTKGTGCTYPLVDLQIPLHVVSSVKTPVYATGGASSWMTQTYQYEGLKAHVAGRGLLGFAKTTISNDVMGTTTVNEMSGWSAENMFTPTTIEEETTINGISGSQKKVTTMSFSGGTYGHGFSYPSVVTTTDFDNHTTKTIYTYNTNKGIPTQEKTIYDGGTNTNYKQVSYSYGTAKYGGRWLPTEIVRTQKHPDDTQAFSTKQQITYDAETGLPTKIIDNSQHSTMKLTTENEYYPTGRLKSKKVSGAGLSTITTNYEYDPTHRFLTKSYTTPASSVTTYTYDAWGNVLTETDATEPSNLLTTTNTYDGFGNLTSSTSPEGIRTEITRNWETSNANKYSVLKTMTGQPWVKTWYDKLGRETKTESVGINGIELTNTQNYDARGNVISKTFVSGDFSATATMQYDARNRITQKAYSTGRTTTYSYSDRTVTATTNGRTSQKKYDAWGLLKTSQTPSGHLLYSYKSNGKPKYISLDYGSVNFTYDACGNQLSMTDPRAGTTTYTYNAAGQVISQTDARGITTTHQFDTLNRIQKTTVGSMVTNYQYGTSGYSLQRLTTQTMGNNSISYTYDQYGRIASEKRGLYTTSYEYNAAGRLSKKTYPGNVQVTYGYDPYGNETSMAVNGSTVWTLAGFDGLNTTEEFGTGNHPLVRYTTCDQYGLLTGIRLKRKNSSLEPHFMNFQHNPVTGNLTGRYNMDVNAPGESFSYDDADRLVYASNGHIAKIVQYDYNGSIEYKTDIGYYDYRHYVGEKPFFVDNISNTAGLIPSYDINISYNDWGKVSEIYSDHGNCGRYTITYGPDGQRWQTEHYKTSSQWPDTLRLYMGDMESYQMGVGDATWFFHIGHNVILQKVGISANVQPTVYYAFTDNLGSITRIYHSNGTEVFCADYDPWGKQKVTKNTINFNRGYTGHEMLNDFQLINMNGRMYDPYLGIFLSPDNYVQLPDNSQSFNRYSYCLNNPLKYVDPSGEFFLFTLWNATKDFLVNTFVKSWSQGFNAWSNSSNWISTTNAFKIDMGLYKGNFKQIISRFTWEAPQTILGYLAGSIQNTLYGVKSVSCYGGATAIETYKAKWGGFTLGSFIIGERGLQADPNNPLFQHEYGHYLQSQSVGPFYLQRYGIPSLIDAAGDSDHDYHATEQDANIRAFKYFMKHEPNFEKADGPRWDKRYNPIKGYDWSKPIDSPANQLVLKKGTMSLGWADYVFGPSILIPGFFNVFQLMQ